MGVTPLCTPAWRRRGHALSAIVAALLAAAPAAGQERPWRVRSLAEIRYEGVIPQRWDTSCGAAALATLLTHDLGEPVAERAVATAMLRRTDPIRVRARGGFSLLNMQEYAQARGYEAEGYGDMKFDDLLDMLPAIVPVRFHGYDHFVVVRAVRGGEVHFADPAYGRRSMSVARFERAWEQKVAFVVRRRAQ
jgi:predicted double-glycine peptidase